MSNGQLSQTQPEQKSVEFLALQKKIKITYIIFTFLLLIVAVSFPFLENIFILFGIILWLIILISLLYLDVKYRKYKFGISISIFRTLAAVLLIAGLLSLIGSISICCGGEKARDATRKSHLSQLGAALALYFDDNNSQYLSNATKGVAENIANFSDLLLPKFISTIPSCPDFKGGKKCVYYYLSCNQNQGFIMYTDLEDKKGIKYFVDSKGNGGETKMPTCPSQ